MQDFINSTAPNRSVGHPGHAKAKAFLISKLEKIQRNYSGAKVYTHKFYADIDFAVKSYKSDFNTLIKNKMKKDDPNFKKWEGFTKSAIKYVEKYREIQGENIILELKGTKKPNEVLYVGAHYDSITHNHATMTFTPLEPTQGADDNASGVVALLKIADALSRENLERTVRFILFDFEEVFFLGSYAYAKDKKLRKLAWQNKDEKYLGLMNLEMVGHSKEGKVAKVYLQQEINGIEANLANRLTQNGDDDFKFVAINNGFNRSDNWSFWQHGFPAITISQDWESDFNQENYHTNHDNIEDINFDYLAMIIKRTKKTLLQIINH